MGNEMGNNNTSEFREEEQAKAEVGDDEVKEEDVADFHKKEAVLGSDDADRVNGDHHIIMEEEEKNKACNMAEFQVVSEKLPEGTKENYEAQAKSKDDKTKEFDSEEYRSDGYEHEHEHKHEKQAPNQKEKEEGRGFHLNTKILALDEPKLKTASAFKSTQHELLDIKAQSLVEDSNKSPEECKDALGLRLNNTYHSADRVMTAISEETIDMDRVIGIDDSDKDNGVRGKGSNFNVITQASGDPKSEKTSDFDANQFLDSNRDANKEVDRKSDKDSNFDTMIQSSEDPNSEKTSEFDVDQVHDTDRDMNNEDDRERVKGSNPNTITQASKDPKSEQFSNFDADQDIDIENDAARQKGSNFNTITQAAKDPNSEKASNFDVDQKIDAGQDKNKEDDGEKGKCINFDPRTQASEDSKFENTSKFDVDQVIDIGTNQDKDKEHDTETVKGSNLKTLHAVEDLKSENNSDIKSIHHEIPATKAESLAGSSDDESPQESKYCLSSSLKHTEGNGIGAEAETDNEKKKGDLIEPRSCHKYTIPGAQILDTKDDETAIDLIGHNSSYSPPELGLVIESPKSSMQAPEVENRCTVLKEESQLREEHLGTETIIQENIPTKSMISNAVQEEFNTIGSHSENNAEETEVSPESVVKNKNQNEPPEESCEDSDGEYLEISEQGMVILTSSIGDSKHMNKEIGETTEISKNTKHEVERREPEESLFKPLLGFQPQIHETETSIPLQTVERIDESISTLKQEAETETEKSKKNTRDSQHYIQTASATLPETKPSTNPIAEQSVTTALPFSTCREERQESPGRTSNESNSDNSIANIEMRKSPSFNIDIQIEGKSGETEKIPLLYQTKTIEDLPNQQEISFPNPTEKRVVKLRRSDSEKSRPSFPGFVKEKEESEKEFEAIDQHNLTAAKKAVKDLPAPSPIRKGKRRSKSLIFGTCICCATAIN